MDGLFRLVLEGGVWDLIILIPDYCFSIFLRYFVSAVLSFFFIDFRAFCRGS